MASSIQFNVTTSGLPEVTTLLSKFGSPDTMRTLHQRWGTQGMNWVTLNFEQEGALTGSPWAKLKPSTIANRKHGGDRILQDKGAAGLKGSFVMKFDETQTIIGSPVFYSEFHETGRTGPWAIKPKNPDGVLAFKGANGKTVFAKLVMHPGYPARSMLPRSTNSGFMDRLRIVAVNLFNQLSATKG